MRKRDCRYVLGKAKRKGKTDREKQYDLILIKADPRLQTMKYPDPKEVTATLSQDLNKSTAFNECI